MSMMCVININRRSLRRTVGRVSMMCVSLILMVIDIVVCMCINECVRSETMAAT